MLCLSMANAESLIQVALNSGMKVKMHTRRTDRCCRPQKQHHIWNSRRVSINIYCVWPFHWTVCRWITHVLRPQSEILVIYSTRVYSNQDIYLSQWHALEVHTSVRVSATGLPGATSVFMWEKGSELLFTLSHGFLDGLIKNTTTQIYFLWL